MPQQLYFIFLITMCLIIKARITVANTKNVLMENDTVSPLSEQPEFEPHPYSGPGSSMGITYDSKILADKSARKLLKTLSLSPSSATKLMALDSATTQSKATPPPEPPKSKPFVPFVPRPSKPPAPPTPLTPPTLPTQPEPPAPSPLISAPPVSTSTSAGTQPPELPMLFSSVLEPTMQANPEKTSQSAQSTSPTSQDAKKPFKLFKWPSLFGSKSTKPPAEPKKSSDSIATPTHSPPIESSLSSTSATSVNLPVQSNTPAYSEKTKPSRFFKFPKIFVPRPTKSSTVSSNEHQLSNASPQTASKLPSDSSPPKIPLASATSVVPTSPETPEISVEPQVQNNTPVRVETSKPQMVSSSSAAMDSSLVISTSATPVTPASSATLDNPSTQSKTHEPTETIKPSNKFSFSSIFAPKPTKPLVSSLKESNKPSDVPQSKLVTEAESPIRASSSSDELPSLFIQPAQYTPTQPALTVSIPADHSSTFTSLESSLETLKSTLLPPPSPSKIFTNPVLQLQSPSVSAVPLIAQPPSISPSLASFSSSSLPPVSSPLQHSFFKPSSSSSSFSSSFLSPGSSSSSTSSSLPSSFKSPSSSFSSSIASSEPSASTPSPPTNFGSKPVKSSSGFDFNKIFGSIMDGFASMKKPRFRRAENKWSSTRRSYINPEDHSLTIQPKLKTDENAELRTETETETETEIETETETETEEDKNQSTVRRESGSDEVENKKRFNVNAQENESSEEISNFIEDEGPLTKIQKLNHVEDRNLHTTLLKAIENEEKYLTGINEGLITNESTNLSDLRRSTSSENENVFPNKQILHGKVVKGEFKIKHKSNENTSMERNLNNVKFENQVMAKDLQHNVSMSYLTKNKRTTSKVVSITPLEISTRARNNKVSLSKEGQTERQSQEDVSILLEGTLR